MKKLFNVAVIGLLLWAGGVGVSLAKGGTTDEDPRAMVRETIEQMLALLKDRKEELQKSPGKIYGIVEDVVVPKFDFERISRYALGRYWRRASKEQREEFTKEFKNLLIRTYAKSLLNYSDQKVEYLQTRRSKDPRRVTVMTLVREEGGPKVPINYRLYHTPKGWRVYDVVIDGVSLVSNYRKSFSDRIRRVRLAGLIEELKKKNAQAM